MSEKAIEPSFPIPGSTIASPAIRGGALPSTLDGNHVAGITFIRDLGRPLFTGLQALFATFSPIRSRFPSSRRG